MAKTTEKEKTIGELKQQKRKIDVEIRNEQKALAIEHGEVVELMKDLKCKHHPKSEFVRTHDIGEGLGNRSGWYVCKECQKEVKAKTMQPFQISTAYSCPHCGFVYGHYESRPYESPHEDWVALAGRKGTHFYCRICGLMIGYAYYMMS